MITARRLPSLLVAWALVVVAATATNWFVIGRAGSAVGAAASGRAIQVTASAEPERPGQEPSSAAEPSGGGGAEPATEPASADPAQTATWTGAAGRITVTCRGGLLTLNSILPADGYRVEQHQGSGTRLLEVELKGPRETHVKATCSASGPVFSTAHD